MTWCLCAFLPLEFCRKFIQGEIKVSYAGGETRALKLFVNWEVSSLQVLFSLPVPLPLQIEHLTHERRQTERHLAIGLLLYMCNKSHYLLGSFLSKWFAFLFCQQPNVKWLVLFWIVLFSVKSATCVSTTNKYMTQGRSVCDTCYSFTHNDYSY